MPRIPKSDHYPEWICMDCGAKYGRWPEGHVATFNMGICGWCGEKKIVTEPRDYNYPMWPIIE